MSSASPRVFPIHGKGHRLITSVAAWREFAPPKRAAHWQAHRSARTLAEQWLAPPSAGQTLGMLPLSVGRLLADVLPGFTPDFANAEVATPLDGYGTGRNHDLVVVGSARAEGRVVLGIEGKVNESFGSSVASAFRRGRATNGSRIPARIRATCRTLFGENYSSASHGSLRYQLLYAATGTALAAQAYGAATAAFVVHELRTPLWNSRDGDRNHQALKRFVSVLADDQEHELPAESLAGPFRLHRVGLLRAPIDLFVGVASTNC